MTTSSGAGIGGERGEAQRSAATGARARRGRRLARLRSAVAGAAGVLLVIGASTVGLHEWADAHLDGQAAHAPVIDFGSGDA